MPYRAWLSVTGMYDYDETLFDDVAFPSVLDRESVITEICLQCAELEIIYPSVPVMKKALKAWSDSHAWSWQKLADTLSLDYNPIWNKDGTISETRHIDRQADTTGVRNNTGRNTHSVTGFNEDTFRNADRDDLTGKEDTTGSETGSSDETYTRRETGNIGVTTTQQMLKEEREVSLFNLTQVIVDSFKERFCILLY